MQSGAFLRDNFEKCYSVYTDLVKSGWFSQYVYLYTVMIPFFWGGGVGESFYPSNTLDRTLHVKLLFTLSSMNNKD